MDSEFYFEESNPRSVKIIGIVLSLIVVVAVFAFIYLKNMYTINIRKSVSIEVGDKLNTDLDYYVKNKIVDKDDYRIFFTRVPLDENGNTTSVGEFEYKVKFKSITKKGTIKVVDTTSPKVEVNDLTIGIKEDYDVDEFIKLCDDYSRPCQVEYKRDSDADIQSKAGTYNIDLIIKDAYGNKTTKTANLIVKKGFSREKMKKSDLTIDHIEPDYNDWNQKMILTYSEGVYGDELDDNERYSYLQDLAAEDLSQYLPIDKSGLSITESEFIYVYNKYNYVIGFAIRVKLSNGEFIYLTK